MFTIITKNPVALDSRDHIAPHGTMRDNSVNLAFNNKMYSLLKDIHPLRVMDMGCSGGGFVKTCIDDGHIAVGLEGSDYSLNRKRAEWATIPENLFTCDVTHPFEVLEDGKPTVFDVITAWELMEHIPTDRLPALCDNVKKHLSKNGIWIMSVSPNKEYYHVTVKNKEWWTDLFIKSGFVNRDDYVKYFHDDWVRGPSQNAGGSFHFILQKENNV